jgi:hypothetical protein
MVMVQEAPPIPGARTVASAFQPVIQQLQTQSIPVVLPTELPFTAYPYLRSTDSQSYEISLDHTPDCRGAGYCNDGVLKGERITQTTPSIQTRYSFETQPNFQPEARSPEQIGNVALARGTTGYFVPYVCGANCDSSKVVWDQGSYRYTVGIRYGAKATVIALANSAIENEK